LQQTTAPNIKIIGGPAREKLFLPSSSIFALIIVAAGLLVWVDYRRGGLLGGVGGFAGFKPTQLGQVVHHNLQLLLSSR